MNILQKIFLGFNIAAVMVLSYFTIVQKKTIKHQQDIISSSTVNVDSLVNLKDSIQIENFNLGVTVMRYEITLEILEERNSRAADEFNHILLTETE